MMPPDGHWTRPVLMLPKDRSQYLKRKYLRKCGYYLHRRVIGDNRVYMSNMKCETDYTGELSWQEKTRDSPLFPLDYIQAFLQLRETLR